MTPNECKTKCRNGHRSDLLSCLQLGKAKEVGMLDMFKVEEMLRKLGQLLGLRPPPHDFEGEGFKNQIRSHLYGNMMKDSVDRQTCIRQLKIDQIITYIGIIVVESI